MITSNPHFSTTQEPGAGLSGVANSPGTGSRLLSIAHISPQPFQEPFIEFVPGANYFKVSRGGYPQEKKGGGKRGAITGFSRGSRRRLMVLMSKIPEGSKLPAFVTLTYPFVFPTPAGAKSHLDNFLKRFARAFPMAGAIWKLEPQDRGAPHFHLLVWGVDLADLSRWVPQNWYQIAGGGDKLHYRWHSGLLGNKHCVQAVNSHRGVIAYASKYLGKSFEQTNWVYTGRFWGVFQRTNIPFGSVYNFAVDLSKANLALRYQRSFIKSRRRINTQRALASGQVVHTKKRKNFNPRSQVTFCDASRWVINILRE